jgi:multiple sugar transport system permease protein
MDGQHGHATYLILSVMSARTPRRTAVRHLLIYGALTPFLVIALFPLLWMLITAFKNERELYSMRGVPFWLYEGPTLKHFDLLFNQTWFGTWVLNTAMVSVWVVAITVLTAIPAGYALARLRLPGADNIAIAIFLTYLVPSIVLFLPLAYVVGRLGLFDSWWALVLLYPTFTIPLCTWLVFGFFRSVPKEIEEAAWVDGCGLLSGIVRVMLPLSRPGVAITSIFAFTLAMQEYLYAVVMSSPVDQKVVTVGMPTMLIRGDIFFWGSLMAGGLLVGIPVAILFNLVIDRFIQGLTGVSAN